MPYIFVIFCALFIN